MLHSRHISAYLPYKVFAAQPRLGKIELYSIYGLKYSNYAREWVVYIDDSRHGNYQDCYLKGISLALRPLGDLLKTFIHNDVEINPKEQLSHLDLELLVNSQNPVELAHKLELQISVQST